MKKITATDPEYARLSVDARNEGLEHDWPFHWWLEQAFAIWLPGAEEAQIRPSWSTGDKTWKTNYLDIINELGADGWEVVTRKIRASAMGPNKGRETASYPIEEYTVLKRPRTD